MIQSTFFIPKIFLQHYLPKNISQNTPRSLLSEICLQLIHTYKEMKRTWGNLPLKQEAPESSEEVLIFLYSWEDFREDLQEHFGKTLRNTFGIRLNHHPGHSFMSETSGRRTTQNAPLSQSKTQQSSRVAAAAAKLSFLSPFRARSALRPRQHLISQRRRRGLPRIH